MEKLTVKEFLKTLGNLKLKTLITILSILVSLFGITFMLGVTISKKESGIDLKRPFDMKIKIDGIGDRVFTNLTVFSNPFVAEKEGSNNTKDLVIFQDKGDFDNEKIGIIRVKIKEINIFKYTLKSIVTFTQNFLMSYAYAQPNIKFIFGKYNKIKEYHQVLISEKTIYRIFDDGSIIEYKIDDNGKAIPTSFKWIKKINK